MVRFELTTVADMKIKRILLAVDHGSPSWEAARLTAHLAPRLNAAVGVLTVLLVSPRERTTEDRRIREYVTALELTADITREMGAAGAHARAQVRVGEPRAVAGEILEAAAQFHADLVVVGSRGRQDVGSALLGSVSHEVVRRTTRPVLIVSGQGQTVMTPRCILLAVQNRNDLDSSMPMTLRLAQDLNASVQVVHVAGRFEAAAEQAIHGTRTSTGEKAVAEAMITLAKAGIKAHSQVVRNDIGLAPEVARLAEAGGADLVVLGSRQLTLIGEVLIGTVASGVVHRTGLPVVVVPSRRPPGRESMTPPDRRSKPGSLRRGR